MHLHPNASTIYGGGRAYYVMIIQNSMEAILFFCHPLYPQNSWVQFCVNYDTGTPASFHDHTKHLKMITLCHPWPSSISTLSVKSFTTSHPPGAFWPQKKFRPIGVLEQYKHASCKMSPKRTFEYADRSNITRLLSGNGSCSTASYRQEELGTGFLP